LRLSYKKDNLFILEPPSIEEEEDVSQEPKGMLIVNNRVPLLAGINDDPRHFNTNVKDDMFLSTSHAISASIIGNLQYSNTYNQSSQVSFGNPISLSRGAQSAETFFYTSNIFARILTRPKALTNPFAPASIRIPMVPGRRRWAHTFPMGKITIIIVIIYCFKLVKVRTNYHGIFIIYVKRKVQ
jgi:hypothetical protein